MGMHIDIGIIVGVSGSSVLKLRCMYQCVFVCVCFDASGCYKYCFIIAIAIVSLKLIESFSPVVRVLYIVW